MKRQGEISLKYDSFSHRDCQPVQGSLAEHPGPEARTPTQGFGRLEGAVNPKVPDDLAELDRWAVWRMENGAKIPYRASGRRASSVNPLHWGELESARAALAVGNFTGLAFAFFKEDGLVGIDLDNSLDADGNAKPEFRGM